MIYTLFAKFQFEMSNHLKKSPQKETIFANLKPKCEFSGMTPMVSKPSPIHTYRLNKM